MPLHVTIIKQITPKPKLIHHYATALSTNDKQLSDALLHRVSSIQDFFLVEPTLLLGISIRKRQLLFFNIWDVLHTNNYNNGIFSFLLCIWKDQTPKSL